MGFCPLCTKAYFKDDHGAWCSFFDELCTDELSDYCEYIREMRKEIVEEYKKEKQKEGNEYVA